MRHMRVGTKCHTENIDIDRLSSLDLGKMKDSEIHWIRDRNWIGDFIDIPCLTIKKTIDYSKSPSIPHHEFGTAYYAETNYETRFFQEDLWYFRVFATEVKKYEATETP
jgi:hypothetical protein